MKISYLTQPRYHTVGGFKQWNKHSVIPGNNALARGLNQLRAAEILIFRTADWLNEMVPGLWWSYDLHNNGSFNLTPINGEEFYHTSPDGESVSISADIAGMAWTLIALRSLSRASVGHARFVYSDKFYELQEIIAEHEEAEAIFAVFDDWD